MPTMKNMKLPKNALVFNENHDHFAKVGDDKIFEMLAYSGKPIKGHWYWGDLMIDLNGMKFPKSKYPILQDHMASKKIGFIPKPKNVDNELRFDNITFVDTAESEEFQKLSKQGFPYEASIYAQPTKITRLREGEKAEVNGMIFKGPGTIWDESTFKESSVTVFGHDSQTKSQAFSESDEIEIEVSQEESPDEKNEKLKSGGTDTMNIDQLKKDHPDTYKEVMAKGEAGARLEFSVTEKDLNKKNDTLKSEVVTLSETVVTQGESIDKLEKGAEKEAALKLAAGFQKEANVIWKDKLSASDIPDYLHVKVARMVSHDKFVEDGKLNTEKFTAAVDVEIEDWAGRFSTETDESDGFGTSHKKELPAEEAKKLADDDAAWEEKMSSYAGVALQGSENQQ